MKDERGRMNSQSAKRESGFGKRRFVEAFTVHVSRFTIHEVRVTITGDGALSRRKSEGGRRKDGLKPVNDGRTLTLFAAVILQLADSSLDLSNGSSIVIGSIYQAWSTARTSERSVPQALNTQSHLQWNRWNTSCRAFCLSAGR